MSGSYKGGANKPDLGDRDEMSKFERDKKYSDVVEVLV